MLHSVLTHYLLGVAAIECPSLSLTNGVSAYATDTTAQFEIGTVAARNCNAGYALVGGSTRTCMDDDQADVIGVWSGTAPTCERKYIELYIFEILKFCLAR